MEEFRDVRGAEAALRSAERRLRAAAAIPAGALTPGEFRSLVKRELEEAERRAAAAVAMGGAARGRREALRRGGDPASLKSALRGLLGEGLP